MKTIKIVLIWMAILIIGVIFAFLFDGKYLILRTIILTPFTLIATLLTIRVLDR